MPFTFSHENAAGVKLVGRYPDGSPFFRFCKINSGARQMRRILYIIERHNVDAYFRIDTIYGKSDNDLIKSLKIFIKLLEIFASKWYSLV